MNLNETLIDNSAESRLKRLIHNYKEHDAKRNKYYADRMRKLGELQSLVQELEDSNGISDLPNLISTLKGQNCSLRSQIRELQKELDTVRSLLSPELSHIYKNLGKTNRGLIDKVTNLQTEVSNYKAKLEKTKALSDEYLQKLIKLQIR